MYTYHSDKGWFNTAGYKLRWPSSYNVKGIGFNQSVLEMGDEITVVVDKEKFLLNTEKALNFIEENNSYYVMGDRKKVRLGVVSKSLMTPIK